jgi:hypothetical protein
MLKRDSKKWSFLVKTEIRHITTAAKLVLLKNIQEADQNSPSLAGHEVPSH